MKTIFTLNGYFNYGNRLQLFALGKILKKSDDNILTYCPKTLLQRIRMFLKYNTFLKYVFKKEMKLKKFTKKYTPKTSNNVTGYIVVGSDQVWNPDYFENAPYLLTGIDIATKISYAASIGREQLSSAELDDFRNALRNYKAISVRERSAKELLQPLTDKKIEVVLDPTLLLDKIEYERLEKRPRDIAEGERYILCYILGDSDYQLTIEKFAKENNCRVISFSDKKGSNYGVEEFLYLIHHAELVCTDSFHACVFSFIFNKPFVAFRRTGEANYMYSRLQNFIDTFKLKNREYNGSGITKKNLSCDYTEGRKILKKEQEKSLKFLEEALGEYK